MADGGTSVKSADDATFVADEINIIIKDSIDEAIGSNPYNHAKIGIWAARVVEISMLRLASLDKPFKYVVTCILMQKNGAGMITATSCYWDPIVDGSRTIRWENKTMYCIVTIYGLFL